MSVKRVIGIDLGTANSCVAVTLDGKPRVLPDEEGRKTTPSIFAIDATQTPVVGYLAKDQADKNRQNTIFAVKRLIGLKYGSAEVQEALGKLPYRILPAENEDAWVEVNEEPMSPEQVSSHVLIRMKEIAEHYLNDKVHRAVITVPAHFNDAQRQATKDAGRIAGLDVMRIINEPTAAALAYGLETLEHSKGKSEDEAKNLCVFDLGGGTFDVSILKLERGTFDVLATQGDTYLGGEDFDLAIVDYLVEHFRKENNVDLGSDKSTLQRLKAVAKEAKHTLSDQVETTIELPFASQASGTPLHLELTISRKMLEKMVAPMLNRLETPCLQAMADAGLSAADVDEVLLVGGMTRMPAVKRYCHKIFGSQPLDTVDPDEAVALGAAVQAGLLEGLIQGVDFLDVTSLSMGIEVQGGMMHRLIERNTKIPAKAKEIFTTSAPRQPQISIHVLQGESEFAPDNQSLGRFELMGIRPAPRGEPEIEVEFSIDAEGILHVSATDMETGDTKQIEIVATSGLDESKLDELLRAQRLQDEQKQRKELRERGEKPKAADDAQGKLQQQLKTLVFSTQYRLDTEGKSYKGEKRKRLEAALLEGRRYLEGTAPTEKLQQTIAQLTAEAEKLNEFLEFGG